MAEKTNAQLTEEVAELRTNLGKKADHKPTGQDVSLILNIIWVVFAGWWLAVHHLILAVMLAVTLIGIPFALQHLKLAVISLMPVGKDVIEV